MFPIRDHNPAKRTPVVTYALIAINVLVFLAYVPLFESPYRISVFFDMWGVVPARITMGGSAHGLVTSMFLHGGLLHLAGNMLFLFIFGDNVEDQLGKIGFTLFYVASGIGAGLMQVAAAPMSTTPMVGASGAIAGVMGGYLLLFPRARVDIFIFLIVIIRVLPVPAYAVLGLWFGMQVISGSTGAAGGPGVAYWAHAGGFLLGLVMMLPVWLRRGGPAFWRNGHGRPAYPAARYRIGRTHVPRVPRRTRARSPWDVPRVRRDR